MGGLGEVLFGGSSNPGNPSVTTLSTLTPEQAANLSALNNILGAQLGQGVEAYGGQVAAGPSQLQSQLWDRLGQIAGGDWQTPQSAQAIQQLLAGNQDVQQSTVAPQVSQPAFDTGAIQDWYQNALFEPAMRNWEQTVAPSVQEKFIGRNAGSSGAANRAIAGSAENMMSGLNAQLANALYGERQNYNQNQFTSGLDFANRSDTSSSDFVNRLFQNQLANQGALQSIPGIENTSMQGFLQSLAMAQGAGQEQNAVTQNQLNEAYNRWQQGQSYNNPFLNLLSTALGTQGVENVVQPETQTTGLLQTLLGGMGTGIGQNIVS